jgi:hypothetical protein
MPQNAATGYSATRPTRRRNRAGCTLGCLTVLVFLLLVVGTGWLFLLRPYLHNIAQTQLDHAMSSGVQQIPPTIVALPPGKLPVVENSINNLIVLNLAPSDPIKNPSTLIAPDGIHISFQLYGFGCTVSAKPALQNGRLVATNVAVNGPIGLIMSPEELTPLLNQRLSDAQNQLKHPIQSLQLMNHEMDLTLGAPLAA